MIGTVNQDDATQEIGDDVVDDHVGMFDVLRQLNP